MLEKVVRALENQRNIEEYYKELEELDISLQNRNYTDLFLDESWKHFKGYEDSTITFYRIHQRSIKPKTLFRLAKDARYPETMNVFFYHNTVHNFDSKKTHWLPRLLNLLKHTKSTDNVKELVKNTSTLIEEHGFEAFRKSLEYLKKHDDIPPEYTRNTDVLLSLGGFELFKQAGDFLANNTPTSYAAEKKIQMLETIIDSIKKGITKENLKGLIHMTKSSHKLKPLLQNYHLIDSLDTNFELSSTIIKTNWEITENLVSKVAETAKKYGVKKTTTLIQETNQEDFMKIETLPANIDPKAYATLRLNILPRLLNASYIDNTIEFLAEEARDITKMWIQSEKEFWPTVAEMMQHPPEKKDYQTITKLMLKFNNASMFPEDFYEEFIKEYKKISDPEDKTSALHYIELIAEKSLESAKEILTRMSTYQDNPQNFRLFLKELATTNLNTANVAAKHIRHYEEVSLELHIIPENKQKPWLKLRQSTPKELLETVKTIYLDRSMKPERSENLAEIIYSTYYTLEQRESLLKIYAAANLVSTKIAEQIHAKITDPPDYLSGDIAIDIFNTASNIVKEDWRVAGAFLSVANNLIKTKRYESVSKALNENPNMNIIQEHYPKTAEKWLNMHQKNHRQLHKNI